MELVSLKTVPLEFKVALVRKLGYDTDGVYVLRLDGSKLVDEYANVPVTIGNMMILPGGTVILDENPLSLASYFEDHGDIL